MLYKKAPNHTTWLFSMSHCQQGSQSDNIAVYHLTLPSSDIHIMLNSNAT